MGHVDPFKVKLIAIFSLLNRRHGYISLDD